MKIEISLGTEFFKGDDDVYSQYRPFLKALIEVSKDELKSIESTGLEEAITRLLNFSTQHMR